MAKSILNLNPRKKTTKQKLGKFIGTSLSFTINSICRGQVKESQIETLYCGFDINSLTKEEIESLLEKYCKAYWVGHEKKARNIFSRLLASGKIRIKIIDGQPYRANYVGGGHHLIPIAESDSIEWVSLIES